MKRLTVLAVSLLTLGMGPASASADYVTLGSSLDAPATGVLRSQADTAAWLVRYQHAGPAGITSGAVPADGQITEILLKGTALRPEGAPPPLNMVHFQSLDANGDGTRQVYLTSGAFEIPFGGDPDQITTYRPENLCIHKGGYVAFNDEGGWDSTSDGPYALGVSFQVLGAVSGSHTDWFSKDNGTMNGAVLAPPTALQGRELLMRYTLATGDDRSYDCGGPLRDPDGSIHHDPLPYRGPKMHVITPQKPYVQSSGAVAVAVYCHSDNPCAGTAMMQVKGKKIGAARFTIAPMQSFRIPLKISRAAYRALHGAKGRKQRAVFVMYAGSLGVFRQGVTIRH